MGTRTIGVAAAIMAAVAATGCASSGNDALRSQDANAVNQYIVDGKTTRSDVERLYGPPTSTSFANAQNEIWIYRWSRATAKPENFIPYVGAFVGGADLQRKELVILFSEQNVVIRHTMQESSDSVRRNLSASSTSSPPQPAGAATGAVSSASPSASTASAATPGTSGPATPATAPAPIEPGSWACGMHNFSSSSDRHYTINFVIAPDNTITVGSYGNAPATVVKSSPLTFTAVNPRGARLTTFVLKRNRSIAVTGPSLNNPTASFFDEGSCVRT